MVKTKKYGVTHRGVVHKAGVLLSLSAAEEERLVKEGWCSYVEVWPAGNGEEDSNAGPNTAAPGEATETVPDTETADDTEETGPQTDAPEETPPKQSTRSRKK